MKALSFFALFLLLTGCATYYQSYDYSIDRYPADIYGVHVYLWGDHYAPDWEDKARAIAIKMMRRELEAHGLSQERVVITEVVRMEGGGIFVYGFAGSAKELDQWTPSRLEGMIDPRPHPHQEPYARGSGKRPTKDASESLRK